MLFAVACFPQYSTQRDDFDEWHGVVLCSELLANKIADKYSCIYCKTMLYLQHALDTFVIILFCIFLRRRSSVVGLVTGLGAGRFGVRILIGQDIFPFSKTSGAHPTPIQRAASLEENSRT